MGVRRKFSAEPKSEAMALLEALGGKIRQIAEDLGSRANIPGRWRRDCPGNEFWRKYGISSATYYLQVERKIQRLEALDVKRLEELQHENSRLKRRCAHLSLENATLKGVIANKALRPTERRVVVTQLVMVRGLPVPRVCRAVGLGRATYYRPLIDWVGHDEPVIAAVITWVAAKGRWGL